MTELKEPMAGPPAGQSLVVFYLPRHRHAGAFYTKLWDEKIFVGEIENGHAVHYVCKPGKRRFIVRFPQSVGVMEADLSPGKTYDVGFGGSGWGMPKMLPADPEEAVKWRKKYRPLILNRKVASDADNKESDFKWIIFQFTEGKKKHRLTKLPADAHR